MKGKEMSKIAVYFPGVGYHCDKPLLYYARDIACEAGYDKYINVDYKYSCGKIRGNEEAIRETYRILYDMAVDILKDVNWDEYDDILFVSKSIGTAIAVSYANKIIKRDVRHILYTPLKYTFYAAGGCDLYSSETLPQTLVSSLDAIAFIGKSDPWSNVPEVVNMAGEAGVVIHTYEDANHSLETPDTLTNIGIIDDVMRKSKDYIYTESGLI